MLATPSAIHEPPVYLSEIWIYPVKSLAGYRVSECYAGPGGLSHDRQWMITDENGIFLTQREVPQMALLRAAVTGAGLVLADNAEESIRMLVPMQPDGPVVPHVKIWDDRVVARAYAREVNEWLSSRLGRPVMLVGMQDGLSARTMSEQPYPLSFADDFPYHLISQSSLDDLNARSDEPVTARRFRPNFVVDGAEAYADDHWQHLRMGEADFHIQSRCERCVMVNVDPSTGSKTRQPLKTLASYRREGKHIIFGQNLVATAAGMVREGDAVLLH